MPTARAAGLARTVHFCQGYEAPHPHLFAELSRIDEAYRLDIPKVVISAHLVDVLSPLYPGEYHVIPQAIDAASFAPAEPGPGSPRTPPTIGVVGPFEAEMKGIRFALEAVVELRREGRTVRLHRASQMPLTEAERAQCPPDAYDLRRPAADMPAWYAGLDLLIHPSFHAEGFPLPPLESMASGVPVVLTDIPSFRPIPADAVARVPAGRRPGDGPGGAAAPGRTGALVPPAPAGARGRTHLHDRAGRRRAGSRAGRDPAAGVTEAGRGPQPTASQRTSTRIRPFRQTGDSTRNRTSLRWS